jgi:hypothetical protein
VFFISNEEIDISNVLDSIKIAIIDYGESNILNKTQIESRHTQEGYIKSDENNIDWFYDNWLKQTKIDEYLFLEPIYYGGSKNRTKRRTKNRTKNMTKRRTKRRDTIPR